MSEKDCYRKLYGDLINYVPHYWKIRVFIRRDNDNEYKQPNNIK